MAHTHTYTDTHTHTHTHTHANTHTSARIHTHTHTHHDTRTLTTALPAVAHLHVTRRTSAHATAPVGRGVAARARPVSHPHTARGGAEGPGGPGTPVAVLGHCTKQRAGGRRG